MKKYKSVVLIMNHIKSRSHMNLYSKDNEFSSNTMYQSIKNALDDLSEYVFEYESLPLFIDNINKHKDCIIISTIWSGVDSRNRRIFLPAICESYGIKYIGADSYVQALSADKTLSKIYCNQYNIKSAKSVTIKAKDEIFLINSLTYPLVVKPNFEGGSIGISDANIIDNYQKGELLIKDLLHHFKEIIVEEYIEGKEISICITGKPDNIQLFEAVKISLNGNDYFSHQILGFESKKGSKYKQTREVITNELTDEMKNNLLNLYKGLGKVDFMRIDGRLKNSEFYLIELTPDCSLHPDCFLYAAYKYHKYTYTEMIDNLLSLA